MYKATILHHTPVGYTFWDFDMSVCPLHLVFPLIFFFRLLFFMQLNYIEICIDSYTRDCSIRVTAVLDYQCGCGWFNTAKPISGMVLRLTELIIRHVVYACLATIHQSIVKLQVFTDAQYLYSSSSTLNNVVTSITSKKVSKWCN